MIMLPCYPYFNNQSMETVPYFKSDDIRLWFDFYCNDIHKQPTDENTNEHFKKIFHDSEPLHMPII